jgi:hypothetical protein
MVKRRTPSFTTQLLSRIESYLTDHEDKYFLEQAQRIAKENNKLRRQKNMDVINGFVFDGVAYRLPDPVTKEIGLRGLETELDYEMETLLSSRTQRAQEIRQISMLIFLICKDHISEFQDLRDLLPECLCPAFPELAQLTRTRPAAFSIQDNPSMQAKWDKALPRIEYYTATRMLY